MKKLFILLITISYSLSLMAQTQTIKGTVIDKQSQFPLIGASVQIMDQAASLGTSTEVDGTFRIENVPLGRHNVQISYIGYENIVLSNIVVGSAKEVDVQVSMEESLLTLDAIVVTSTSDRREVINQMATVSARTVSVEEASRFAGSFQDPSRMAQNYAGVSGATDDRNDIIVRGNSPLGVLWRMEGINIPSPNHFATLGSTGGPVGMMNINNLSNSDFYTSAWSADYGNALSGVFDIKLRNGNRDKREYIGQVGFNGFELGAEGPFKKGGKASYLINYRYSTLGVFKALGLNLGLGTAVPEYQDVNFKVNVPTENAGTFTLWGIAGQSFIEFDNAGEEDSTNLFDDFQTSHFTSKTAIVGLSNTYFLDDKTFAKITVVGSAVESSGDIDTLNELTDKKEDSFNFHRFQYKLSSHLKFNKKINRKNTFSTGVIYDYYQLDMVDSVNRVNGFETVFDVDGGTSLVQSYLNWQYRQNNKMTYTLGLHHQYFNMTKSNTIEPRIGIKYNVTNKASFNIGGGMHSMTQPILTYFIQNNNNEETNKDLGFSKAIHAVIGYDYLISKNLRLKAEIYYQELYDIPVDTFSSSFSYLNAGTEFILPNNTGLENIGSGENYGLEITLEKFFSEGYYFLTTGSFFSSKYKGSDNVERNAAFNGNYVLNALAGKEFKIGKNNTLSIDTKVTYAGGRRYTAIDLAASKLFGREIMRHDLAFEEQYDPYFKWDLKFAFKLNGRKVAQEWSVDLTNLSNQQNIFQRQYSVKGEKITTTYQRGFFPNITYKIYF